MQLGTAVADQQALSLPFGLSQLSVKFNTFTTQLQAAASMRNIAGKYILVTGASSGLGEEMAFQLAKNHKANVILAARRAEKLEALKQRIEGSTDVQAVVVPSDLSKEEDVENLIAACTALPNFDGALLNAGITHMGHHKELQWSYFEKMLSVNIRSVVRLTNAFIEHFEGRPEGGAVTVVSSLAALYPVPFQAAYSGTKGFLTNFVNAYSQELNNPKVTLTSFNPGGIKTEMTGGDEFSKLSRWLEPVEVVASEGIRGFLKGKLTYVPGTMNKISTAFLKLLPRSFVLRQTGKIYRKALED